MQHIYYKDADGKEISVEVTDEVAAAYREGRREEWRGNARERYTPYHWMRRQTPDTSLRMKARALTF